MAKISLEEVLSIQRKVNIVDIIKDYIPLTKKGKNYFGVCPFHDDHNPSMSVSEERQIYKCFVCGASGNVFNFVSEYDKISYYEAVKVIANKIGMDVDIGNVKKTEQISSPFFDMYDITSKIYQNNLNTSFGKEAREYLKNRNISNEIIKEFKIGLATTNTEISTALKKKGYSYDELIKSGLFAGSNNSLYDIYKNRIMFPLYDLDGRVVAFSGRVYNEKSDNKYINTMETDIFKKGNLLYNYHVAKVEARKEKQIIIVEGFMDVIRLSTIGIKNVVAAMGTAITKNQLSLLKKLSQNIIIMFDGDKAGDKATLSLVNMLEDSSLNVKIVRLEDDLDPDEYILTKGKEKMVEHINNAISPISYKMGVLKKDINFQDSTEVSKYINSAVLELEKINDDIIRGIEIKKVSDLTGLGVDVINSYIHVKDEEKIVIKPPKITNSKLSKYDIASKTILFNMLNNNDMILYYYNNLSYLPIELDRKLANEIVLFYKKYNSFNISDFITYLEDKKDLIDLINKVIDMVDIKMCDNEEIDSYFISVKDYIKNNEMNNLINELKNATNDVKRKEIANKIVELKKKECM